MSENTSTPPVQAGDATVATAQPIAPGNLVSGDTVAAPMGAPEQQQGKTISLPTSAFAKLKADAAEKGKRAALTEMQAKAKAFGFDSVDAMFQALETARANPSAPAQQENRATPRATQATQAQPAKQSSNGNVSAEALRIAKDMERARKEAEKASREARRYRQELEEFQATAEMKEVLLRAGVREDVDYALDLMRRDINAKLQTDPELASYSTEEFLKSLRTNKPFLFGEARVAATTGTGGEGVQARPLAPGQAAATTAQADQFDARKASAEQIKARLAQLGVQYSRQ